MAEAVCGPSNPLQQFKQQSQRDRTLQQDRLSSRPSPAQAFRSADPNAGLLDPEFEAFQAGFPPSDLPLYQSHHLQQFPQPSFAASSQAPTWATDFQRMNLSSPPPSNSFAQQQARQTGPVAADWAHRFQEHIAQTAPRAQNSSPSPLAFQQRARYGYNGYQSSFQQPSYASLPVVQSKGKEPVTEQFDDAAFERAFDLAREEMMMEETNISAGVEAEIQAQGETSASKSDVLREIFRNIDEASVQEPRTFDAITTDEAEALREALDRQEEVIDNNAKQEEDDALAATAHELLEKVEHNQTDKFRNSQFLGLMRKLRDREVKVEGDKMVETVSHTHVLPHPHVHPSVTPRDSSHVSGAATPMSWDSEHFDTHICTETNCAGDTQEYDHWESPYI